MSSSNKNTPAYIAYILVSITWYAAILSSIIFVGILVFQSADFVSSDYIVFRSLSLNPDLVQFKAGVDMANLTLDSATAKVSMTNHFDDNPGHYWIFLGFALLFVGISLYWFYQLKALLKSTVNNNVFTKANIRRLKIIAFLVILIDPVRWFVDIIIKNMFSDVAAAKTIELTLGSLELSYFMIGLLLFVLATVFEKGFEMYQELKLTV